MSSTEAMLLIMQVIRRAVPPGLLHLVNQLTALHNVGMVYVVFLIALAVEVYFVYVETFLAQTFGHHGKGFSAGQVEREPRPRG